MHRLQKQTQNRQATIESPKKHLFKRRFLITNTRNGHLVPPPSSPIGWFTTTALPSPSSSSTTGLPPGRDRSDQDHHLPHGGTFPPLPLPAAVVGVRMACRPRCRSHGIFAMDITLASSPFPHRKLLNIIAMESCFR